MLKWAPCHRQGAHFFVGYSFVSPTLVGKSQRVFDRPVSVSPQAPAGGVRWLRVVIPVVIVVVLIAVMTVVGSFGSPARSNVGECLNVTEFKQGAEPAKADCGDPKANVKIAAKPERPGDSCPEGAYGVYSVGGENPAKLCLMINAKQGDCFANFTSQTAGYTKVRCNDHRRDAEFVKIVEGKSDKKLCDNTGAAYVLAFSQPPTTMCVKSDK